MLDFLKPKNHWFLLLILSAATQVVTLPFKIAKMYAFSQFPGWLPLGFLSSNVLLAVALLYILYHFLRQKAWSRLFTFFLSWVPFHLVIEVLGYATGNLSLPSSILGWTYLLVSKGMLLGWYVLTWKMGGTRQILKTVAKTVIKKKILG